MRALSVTVLCLAIGACSMQSGMFAGDPGEPDAVPCPEPRPQVCTMVYQPTCAVLRDGTEREYASPCNACADDRVAATLGGPCPE